MTLPRETKRLLAFLAKRLVDAEIDKDWGTVASVREALHAAVNQALPER